jgi:hypothetical protein
MEPQQAYKVLDTLAASAQSNRAGHRQLDEALAAFQQLILVKGNHQPLPPDPLREAAEKLPKEHVLAAVEKLQTEAPAPIPDKP